jgi:predicted SnoaL-like aldol condensation-catalyzing enzyme
LNQQLILLHIHQKVLKMKNLAPINAPELNNATRDIVMHHLVSFQNNDLESVLADYSSESVVVTRDTTYSGPEEIRQFFATLMIHFPKQQSNFELDKMVVQDELVYIVWHANTPSLDVSLGTDTFIIRDGKIHRQTFAGQLQFK